jgi:hypothetical protein
MNLETFTAGKIDCSNYKNTYIYELFVMLVKYFYLEYGFSRY